MDLAPTWKEGALCRHGECFKRDKGAFSTMNDNLTQKVQEALKAAQQ